MPHRVPPADMVDAWERATRMDDPLLALAAIGHLETELLWWTMALLREAQEGGASWDEIAAALGAAPHQLEPPRPDTGDGEPRG